MTEVALSQNMRASLKTRLVCRTFSHEIYRALINLASAEWAKGNGSCLMRLLSLAYVSTILCRGAANMYKGDDSANAQNNLILRNIDRAVVRLLEETEQQGDGPRLTFTDAAAQCVADWNFCDLKIYPTFLDDVMAYPCTRWLRVQDDARLACCAMGAWMGDINVVKTFMAPSSTDNRSRLSNLASLVDNLSHPYNFVRTPPPLDTTTNSIESESAQGDPSSLDNRCRFFPYPLYAAARQGHLAIVRLLLDRGADPAPGDGYYVDVAAGEGIDTPRSSALEAAAAGGHLDVVQLLLDAMSAGINDDDADAGTSNSSTASLLPLEAYALPALKNALSNAHLPVAQLLLTYLTPEPEELYTLLSASSRGGSEECVRLLLARGSRPHWPSQDRWIQPPLHAAARGGHVGAVRALLGRGFDVGARAGPRARAEAWPKSKGMARRWFGGRVLGGRGRGCAGGGGGGMTITRGEEAARLARKLGESCVADVLSLYGCTDEAGDEEACMMMEESMVTERVKGMKRELSNRGVKGLVRRILPKKRL